MIWSNLRIYEYHMITQLWETPLDKDTDSTITIATCDVPKQPTNGEKQVEGGELPYEISSIKEQLFHVIFLHPENFHANISEIIEQAEKSITEDVFTQVKNKPKLLYNIMVEILDNIKKYTVINEDNKSWYKEPEFSLEKWSSEYTITIHNTCEDTHYKKLQDFAEKLNSSTYQEIKSAYKKQHIEWTISEQWWAWLWMLTVAKLVKEYHGEKTFTFMTVKPEGQKVIMQPIIKEVTDMAGEKRTITVPWEKEIIDTVITIHMPFPEQTSIKDDNHIDEESSLHKSA